MAILAPFRGILYNLEKIDDLSLVVTPPYDVITKEDQERYHRAQSYNIIRLILGKDLPGDSQKINKYTRAAQYLETWQKEDILVRDTLPAIYYYQQKFAVKGKGKKTRRGFIALVKLEDFDSGIVLPHEKTMTGPKVDRLRLMESCNANLSPIFSLYSDPDKKITSVIEDKISTDPFVDFLDDSGIGNRLWKIHEKNTIQKVVKELEDLSLFIADGHHRYETALNYRNQLQKRSMSFNGNEAYNYVMMYLSSMDDEGLVILPTHRLIYNLEDFNPALFYKKAEKYFHLEELEFSSGNELEVRKELLSRLEKQGQRQHAFGAYVKGASHYSLLTLKSKNLLNSGVMDNVPPILRELDVLVLQTFILKDILGINDRNMESQKNVGFIEDSVEGIDLVKKDKYQLVFLMNPTKINQVNEAARAGMRMPQKSTFFYPKLPSGLVINSIQEIMSD